MTPPKPKRLTREEYLEERKELYKYQQAGQAVVAAGSGQYIFGAWVV